MRQYLRTKLPEYMVPAAFVFVDRFPLTSNGKVDRRALPAPDGVSRNLEPDEPNPIGLLEKQLAQLWEEILGVQPLGVQDSFFDVGGTSMMTAQLFSELRKRFGKSLSFNALVQAPTLEKMAELLRNDGGSDPEP